MNKLTSRQRKIAYFVCIIVLFVPIVLLGQPSSPAVEGSATPAEPGGKLARLRVTYDLGESQIGKVDPASASMNLVLLGLRGVAASKLWMTAMEQQKTKNWAALRTTTDAIIMLQPHFLKVWHHMGWNLAYNISVEWDAVADRYYWVKEGIKFYKKGIERNQKYPEMYWYTGDTIGKKIGRSDEWKQFRKYFNNDPDKERFPDGGPDPDLNPEGKDNYEVAKLWFQRSNDIQDQTGHMPHIMANILHRSYPSRAQMDYAGTLQREGIFDEVTANAWRVAYDDWTKKYGREEFDSPGGMIHLEVTQPEYNEMVKTAAGKSELQWVDRYHQMTNYRYWRTRALAEAQKNSVEAHRELYEGEREYLRGDFTAAKAKLFKGMQKFERMLLNFQDLMNDSETIEEALLAQLYWRACLQLDEEPVPASYPLQPLWHAAQGSLPTVEEEFKRRKRNFKAQ